MRKKCASDNDEKWQLTPSLGVGERIVSGRTTANYQIVAA